MVSTQCPKCGKVLDDKDALNEGQAIDKHQLVGCDSVPASSLEEAIKKARNVQQGSA